MDDDTVQDGGSKGGVLEANLSQLPCFTTLNLSGPVGGECTIYRALTSACALCMRGKWLLMPSGFHLRPAAGPC